VNRIGQCSVTCWMNGLAKIHGGVRHFDSGLSANRHLDFDCREECRGWNAVVVRIRPRVWPSVCALTHPGPAHLWPRLFAMSYGEVKLSLDVQGGFYMSERTICSPTKRVK